MTFNLLMLNRSYRGAAASIAHEAADIVALQELTELAAHDIGDRLRPQYPHQALRPAGGFSGSGVLSRFPILANEPFRLSQHGCFCQHLELALPERRLHFFNIHLKAPSIRLRPLRYDDSQRETEAAALAQRLAAHRDSVVVAGDFNMTERSGAYRRLSKLLRDSFREAGSGTGWTFPKPVRVGPVLVPVWPVPFPIFRLDYVFHSRDIEARRVHCGDGDGSDHRPVIATLAFADA
jgi:endonuclease/exonuclease/phosphatase (EEP) superfamily protein YafD